MSKAAKLTVMVLVVLGLFVSSYAYAADAETVYTPPKKGTVNIKTLNVRGGPSTKYKIVGQLKQNDEVIVHAKQKDWYKISTPEGATCWIFGKFLDEKGMCTGDAVRLRTGPGTKTSVVGKVNKGEQLQVVKTKGEWTQVVMPQKTTVWVSAKYIALKDIKPVTKKPTQFELDAKTYQALEREYNVATKENSLPNRKIKLMQVKPKLQNLANSTKTEQIKHSCNNLVASIDGILGVIAEYEKKQKEIQMAKAERDRIENEAKKDIQNLQDKYDKLKNPTPPTYDAVGQVASVGRFIGRPAKHKLVKGGEIICFLTSEEIDIDSFWNQHVGVKGKVTTVIYNDKEVPLIDVSQIDIRRSDEVPNVPKFGR